MKKTLIVTMEFPPYVGGIATYVHDLASTLDPEQTIVLAPMQKGQEEWDALQQYTVIRKKLLFPRFIWPRWMRLCLQVRKLVKEHKIELIMIHHVLPAGYAGVMMKKARKWKIPFLLFSHGTDLVAGTASKWKRRMVTKVSSYAEQIIFNSESLKRRYLQVLPQFEDKSLVVYPCPEEQFLTPPPQDQIDMLHKQYALSGKTVMLSVSRLTDGKGFPHLIRMMPELLKRVPHLVWLIVGGGPKMKELAADVQEAGLQNVIRFVGEVPHAALNTYYHLADLFVLLTHPDDGREEGLGLVFLEASAAGLPIVAGKSGGVEEAVLHTQTGIVVDMYKGEEHVVDAIVEMIENKEYAARLGRAAQDRIRSSFVWKNQIRLLDPWLQ